MVHTKSQESRKILVKFRGSQSLIFSQKAVSESRIVKTKEIGEKASRVRKKMPCLEISQSLALTIRYPLYTNTVSSLTTSLCQDFSNNLLNS